MLHRSNSTQIVAPWIKSAKHPATGLPAIGYPLVDAGLTAAERSRVRGARPSSP
jgi:hypothetical protein